MTADKNNDLKIRFFGYNTFIIETSDKKIAIDPGALFFYYFRMTTLIPKDEWETITHILVTHGDPDHYWHADRVAKASGAPVVCNKTMLRNINGMSKMLGPRARGLGFNTVIESVSPISPNESIDVNGVTITGLKATHGPMILKIGPISKIVTPGPDERVGWGAIGYKIEVDGYTIVNLGDTFIHLDDWEAAKGADILMIPIGGNEIPNTMNQEEAVEAAEAIHPKNVIPCHYNCPGLFSKRYNSADEEKFKAEVEKAGLECTVLQSGQSFLV
jgi:L-ascorbate metabolism protein UlaG (beta-lactamase superfamily)